MKKATNMHKEKKKNNFSREDTRRDAKRKQKNLRNLRNPWASFFHLLIFSTSTLLPFIFSLSPGEDRIRRYYYEKKRKNYLQCYLSFL
jgi:hypothetical protein